MVHPVECLCDIQHQHRRGFMIVKTLADIFDDSNKLHCGAFIRKKSVLFTGDKVDIVLHSD